MRQLRLNCDLAEGAGLDERIIPLIDMANIACGLHAGSWEESARDVALAREHGVMIGAHPGYPDREHFGRRSLEMGPRLLRSALAYQIGALEGICRAEGAKLEYVKPHGALYNDMMRDQGLFESIVRWVADLAPGAGLMLLAVGDPAPYREIADRYGVGLIYELFADRNYLPDGSLVPRSHPEAVIHDPARVVERIRRYREEGVIADLEGRPLRLEADSVCVHGDTPEALEMIEALRNVTR